MRTRTSINRALVIAVVLLGAATIVSAFAGWPGWLTAVGAVSLTGTAAVTVAVSGRRRADHEQAMRSHHNLEIADESLTYMRQGLSEDTAEAVCRIAFSKTDAAAVSITGTRTILGFAGAGEDHHQAGSPILTRATREALADDNVRVVHGRAEIACPNPRCPLTSAVVVPLHVSGAVLGALKFYFVGSGRPDETDVAMAEGLAGILSTQLELSELDRQTQLACSMELKALQAQINPHFLFNTINTVASLIRTDAPQARELLRDFAAFYRRTLESGEDLIPLAQELEYVRAYFRFEEARFGNRVRLAFDVQPRHERLLVPAFIVQPLVENAVRHGMPPEGPLTVQVTSVAHGDEIVISVGDDGVGMQDPDMRQLLDPASSDGMGIALKNVNDRLRGHFGPESGLRLQSRPGEGTVVSLAIRRTSA